MKLLRILAAMVITVAVALPSFAKKSPKTDPSDTPRAWTQLLWPDGAPHPKQIKPDAEGKVRDRKSVV